MDHVSSFGLFNFSLVNIQIPAFVFHSSIVASQSLHRSGYSSIFFIFLLIIFLSFHSLIVSFSKFSFLITK
ncbi:MAG TPA: hypothetical protein VIQ00_05035, partial [Chitinophagaceae bacterium]